jgi:hypothetical protein
MIQPTWNKRDGCAKYVYDRMPIGSRCAWTVNWRSAEGLIRPIDLVNFDQLNPIQKYHEASDYSTFGIPHYQQVKDVSYRLALLMAKYHNVESMNWNEADPLIEAARGYIMLTGRPEYLCSWSPPPKTYRGRPFVVDTGAWRPGWPTAVLPDTLPENEAEYQAPDVEPVSETFWISRK